MYYNHFGLRELPFNLTPDTSFFVACSSYQEALNTVSQAVLTGDFFRYAAMIDLPYLVHTADADLLVTTTADLRPAFDAVHQGLTSRGVTHYERVARSADPPPAVRSRRRHQFRSSPSRPRGSRRRS